MICEKIKMILFASLVFLTCSCTALKFIPIEDAQVYQLEKSKNEITKNSEGLELGKMKWYKDSTCTAVYFNNENEASYCFNYIRKPERIVQILSNENQLGNITDIKKHNSYLYFQNDSILLRPIQGQIVAIHNEKQIARVFQNKSESRIEIAPNYANNKLLISALLYKNDELRKTNSSSGDDFLLYYIIFFM